MTRAKRKALAPNAAETPPSPASLPTTAAAELNRDPLVAARALYLANPAAALVVAGELRNIAQPLRIFADSDRETIAVIARLAKLASCIAGS